MNWVRGSILGHGSSSSVHLAFIPNNPSVTFVVKSSPISSSSLLQNEENILNVLQGCPQIIPCFGHDITNDPIGPRIECNYNLFLEYASNGSLSDEIRRFNGSLPAQTTRHYLRSILRGLRHIHAMGYAHCDIKPQNILIFDGEAKIADFGLAKRADEESVEDIRGTPMYLAPESVSRKDYGSAVDIWALGCTVLEIVSGRKPWRESEEVGYGIWAVVFRIGFCDEVPEIPPEMSEDCKDFLRCCFEREPRNRWTAEMLLSHPFLASSDEGFITGTIEACSVLYRTPRSVFDISIIQLSLLNSSELVDLFRFWPVEESEKKRILELGTEERPDWGDEEGWINVREDNCNEVQQDEIFLLDEFMYC